MLRSYALIFVDICFLPIVKRCVVIPIQVQVLCLHKGDKVYMYCPIVTILNFIAKMYSRTSAYMRHDV